MGLTTLVSRKHLVNEIRTGPPILALTRDPYPTPGAAAWLTQSKNSPEDFAARDKSRADYPCVPGVEKHKGSVDVNLMYPGH